MVLDDRRLKIVWFTSPNAPTNFATKESNLKDETDDETDAEEKEKEKEKKKKKKKQKKCVRVSLGVYR